MARNAPTCRHPDSQYLALEQPFVKMNFDTPDPASLTFLPGTSGFFFLGWTIRAGVCTNLHLEKQWHFGWFFGRPSSLLRYRCLLSWLCGSRSKATAISKPCCSKSMKAIGSSITFAISGEQTVCFSRENLQDSWRDFWKSPHVSNRQSYTISFSHVNSSNHQFWVTLCRLPTQLPQ